MIETLIASDPFDVDIPTSIGFGRSRGKTAATSYSSSDCQFDPSLIPLLDVDDPAGPYVPSGVIAPKAEGLQCGIHLPGAVAGPSDSHEVDMNHAG